MKRFLNRHEAGLELAEKLDRFAGRQDVIVLGLARGGVPVAYEVARTLDLPLDVFVVRKLGAPGHEEFAIGAIATGGVRVLNQEAVQLLGLAPSTVERITMVEQQELERRENAYRGGRGPVIVRGRTVIVIDDGLATGATMKAAVAALRRQAPKSIIVAAPVVARDTKRELDKVADGCEYVLAPEPFYGVGLWYTDFSPTTDREVQLLLEAAAGDGVSPVSAPAYQF
jgi:putative phosphoribosyl transferase